MCAGGATTAVGLTYANVTGSPAIHAWIAGSLWVFVGVIFIAATPSLSPPARRGFNSRWTGAIVAWVILWSVNAFLNTHFTLGTGIAMSAAFMVLALGGSLWELMALSKAAQ